MKEHIVRLSEWQALRISTFAVSTNAVIALATIAAIALIYYPAVLELVAVWRDDILYSHGFLIAPVSVWLIARAAPKLKLHPVLPSIWLFAAIGVCAFSWLLGFLSATGVVQIVALVVLLFLGLLVMFGVNSARKLWMPAGLMFLCVPVWGFLEAILQGITIFVNSILIRLSGRNAYIEGDFVFLADGAFEIAEGCSGAHFFLASLVIGMLYTYLNLSRLKYQSMLLVTAMALALLANWTRVFTIILIGDLTNMSHYLVTVDHYYFGWIVYAVWLLPLFFVGRTLQNRERRERGGSDMIASRVTGPGIEVSRDISGFRMPVRVTCGLLALAWAPLYAATLGHILNEAALPDVGLPTTIGSWSRVDLTPMETSMLPSFVGADSELSVGYESAQGRVLVYRNVYRFQRRGAELITYGNRWFPDQWMTVSTAKVTVDGSGVQQSFALKRIAYGRLSRVTAHGYVVAGGRVYDSAFEAKLRGSLSAVVGRPAVGAVFVSMECDGGCDGEELQVTGFLADLASSFSDATVEN